MRRFTPPTLSRSSTQNPLATPAGQRGGV